MLFKTFRVISSKARNLAACSGEKGLLGETKVNGAEAHSSGKINLPSSQTDAHFASASLRFVGMTTSLYFLCHGKLLYYYLN